MLHHLLLASYMHSCMEHGIIRILLYIAIVVLTSESLDPPFSPSLHGQSAIKKKNGKVLWPCKTTSLFL